MITREELLRRVRRIEITTQKLVQETLGGQYHSTFKGRGIEFDTVRPYVAGDDIRAIDWNVTARTGGLHVKQFVEERELNVGLLVDSSLSLDFGSRHPTKAEVAAEIAALIAFSALSNNDRVSLLAFAEEVRYFLPPRKGRGHVLRLVSELLTLGERLEAGPSPSRASASQAAPAAGTRIDRALEYFGRLTPRRAILFVLSDFRAAADFERPLKIASRRHEVIPLVVRDAWERELPDLGLAAFHDPESGEEILFDCGDPRARERYARRAAEEIEALKTLFLSLNLRHGFLWTDRDYAGALVRMFRQRPGMVH